MATLPKSKNSDIRKYLDPEFVSQLNSLDLIARLVVEGFIIGLHRSPYHGFSTEFSEYRPYMSGEDTSNIDWKVWGRTERYYIKRFEEETNLKAHILLDVSNSMGYTSHKVTKHMYANYLSAAFIYLILHQRDAVGLLTFDDKVRSYHQPRSVKSYLRKLLIEIDRTKVGGETSLSTIFHDMAERIKRRGLIIIISDLWDDQDQILSALKHFRHRKHEVIVFHLLDPQEVAFAFKKDALFIDRENGEEIQLQPWQIKKEYQKMVSDSLTTYKQICRAQHIDYIPIQTDQTFDKALLHYLAKRKRLKG